MYKRDKMLKEIAEKRLSAIREFTDLGSGFKIAMRDLEIRGQAIFWDGAAWPYGGGRLRSLLQNAQ